MLRSLSLVLGGLSCAAVGVVVGMNLPAAQAEPAADQNVYELRVYKTVEGRLPALNDRFREHTLKLFEKHGMKNIVYTTPVDQPNELVYLLAHKSKAAADESFEAFRQDPEWIAARDASEKSGKIVESVTSTFLTPTDYSPMK